MHGKGVRSVPIRIEGDARLCTRSTEGEHDSNEAWVFVLIAFNADNEVTLQIEVGRAEDLDEFVARRKLVDDEVVWTETRTLFGDASVRYIATQPTAEDLFGALIPEQAAFRRTDRFAGGLLAGAFVAGKADLAATATTAVNGVPAPVVDGAAFSAKLVAIFRDALAEEVVVARFPRATPAARHLVAAAIVDLAALCAEVFAPESLADTQVPEARVWF